MSAAAQTDQPLLEIRDLTVDYRRPGGSTQAVRGVSFQVARGETVALVGESGSGKTTIGRAVLGLHHRNAQITGSIRFSGTELVGLAEAGLRRLRGRRIALIPQDPLAGLNPVHPIGEQVSESLRTHGLATGAEARRQAVQILERAGLDDAANRYYSYPHQLSGGQRQRVLIGIALAAEPDLIVADEPTSALDVTVQRRILDHIEELVTQSGTSLLLVTHDLGVAADRADRVVVLQHGQVVEQLPAADFLNSAEHPYSQRLAAAAPTIDSEPLVTQLPQTQENDAAQPLVRAQGLTKTFPVSGGGSVTAVDAVDLTLRPGQSLGVVGESGSGKTTVARMILGLSDPDAGSLTLAGLGHQDYRSRSGRKELRRLIRPVFQDPYSSLDPAHSVATSIAEPLRALTTLSRSERQRRVTELLEQVHLPSAAAGRKPYELSGGQLQRVAIARALAVRPKVLVCDEPVSSLDVSVQDQILRLLAELREAEGLSYLFISHDLAVVRQVCTEVVVMRHGQVVERGATREVFAAPEHEYTRELVAAIPGSRVRQQV
ncbi:dipeptide ABC transporter ATP-binding protein [Nesterenkonia alkaliphila]|uniref:Dipeptide ABC transporter ATP-binding protein n=1 Tax=Nesterenkonia alkaliphila TaxID=1463631 RepID=A0A7K1UMF3_9MICC|nr:ABC transporter ATP-binding protein [Nesterenkonia alkaliphila]MVT27221.1 dipeptide ABC transporter ATP-binding protein [Nesterenkonia alkaliphila]GFZ78498.1 peptide ABC transporter ATP-binding protein [Nesterenkonia alkaliphila]